MGTRYDEDDAAADAAVELIQRMVAGHSIYCLGFEEEMAELAQWFVGIDFISYQLMEAARCIKSCKLCSQKLEEMTQRLGGELPQAWHELQPARDEPEKE